MVHFIRLKSIIPYIFLSLCILKRSLGDISECTAPADEVKSCKVDDNVVENNVYCIVKTGEDPDQKSFLYKSGGENSCTKASTGTVILGTDFKESTTFDNTIYVYQCDSDECTQYTSGYYLRTISGTNKLYKCENDGCKIQSTFAVGYYLTGIPTGDEDYPGIIKCSKANTASNCIKVSQIKKGYYLDGSVQTASLISCETNTCTSISASEGYYLDSDSEVTTNGKSTFKKLINCSSSSCSSVSEPSNGFYVDAEKIISAAETPAETPVEGRKRDKIRREQEGAEESNQYTSLISCTNKICTKFESVTNSYYINGVANKFNKALINCVVEESKICQEITLTDEDANTIYLTHDKNLIRCTTKTVGCSADSSSLSALYGTSNIPKYFVNSGENVGTKAVIKCTGVGNCVAQDYVEGTVFFNGNFNDGINKNGVDDQLIICQSDSCVTTKKDFSAQNDRSKIEIYLNHGDYTNNNGKMVLIKCYYSSSKTKCDPIVGVKNEFYINSISSSNEKYMITCTSTTNCAYYSNPSAAADSVEYYLNGARTDKTNGVIKCVISENTVEDAAEDAAEDPVEDPVVDPGRKKRDTTLSGTCSILTTTSDKVYINSASNRLIQCSANGCSAINGKGTNQVKAYYINGDIPESSTSYEGLLIECGEKCTIVDGKEDAIYVNSNIKVTGDNGNPNGVADKPLIICKENKCEDKAAAAPGFYLNGAANGNDRALIECTSTTLCSDYSLPSSNDQNVNNIYFVHAAAADKLENAIIECPISDTETNNAKREGEEVEEEEEEGGGGEEEEANAEEGGENTSICSINSGNDKDIYINGANKKQIIRCTSSNCVVANTSPTTKKSEYYLADNNLIQCTTEGCKVFEGEVTNKVFINANFGNGKDTENQLIKCTGSTAEDEGEAQEGQGGQDGQDGQDGLRKRQEEEGQEEEEANQSTECSLSQSSATEKPEFYVNGDETNSEILKGDLIKCIKGENNIINCSEMDGNLNNVYLNANYDAESNDLPIIICKKKEENSDDTGGCIEMSVENDDEESNDNSEDTNKYYVNSGSVNHNLSDTLILCNSSENTCSLLEDDEDIPKASDIYINAVNNQLIYCSEEKGCEAMQTQANKDNNEFYLNASDSEKDLVNDLIKCEVIEDEKICKAINGVEGKVYIDNYTKGNIIYCTTDDGCQSESSFSDEDKSNEGLPKFYVNGDDIDFEDDEDKDPLNGDLIKCTKTGTDKDTKITCIVTKGDKDNVYLNSNYGHGDSTNQLIICTESEGCLPTTCSSSSNQETANLDKRQENEDAEVEEEESSEKFPKFYINSGNPNKLVKGIIKCTSTEEACTLHTAKSFEVYKNGNDNETTKPIIKCGNNNCKTSESSASENNNEYFKNAGNDGETPLEYDIIECSKIGESDASCVEVENANEGVYLNSYYMENGDKEQLIQCSSDNGCVGLRTESKDGQYFVNAEAQTITNAVIFCINKKCEKQTPNSIPSFYVGYMKDEVDGLIKCTDKETTCEFKAAFTSQGYYINDGYNKAQNQTILCDSSDGCAALKVDLGYYINEGEPTKPIIKCEKEGSECIADVSPSCPEIEAAKPGNYCYDDGQLKFFPENNSTYVSASKSEDVYTFATIPDNGFPGIKRETGSLFKISRYFINRFYKSGVVMIDKNGKLVDSLSSDQSDITLYDCNDSTKICTKKPGCTSNTYMYDTENAKAIFCNNGKLEYAEFNGYVVDSNRAVGTNHPYIINCENGKCKSVRPKNTSYYENNGYDSTTNALILCSNNNCYTVTAEVGYYVGHNGSGIIQCTSTTSCNYNDVKSKVKYVNSGANKSSHAIIGCDKSGCSATKAKIGYYMTYSSNLLIQCTSPGSCVEFTPTVNYYDNADSSEGSNTIINCVQSSQVITCATEQTNNGFYMSSSPNVLIRCKSGSKCKTVVVKNGIFRGALKGLTGGSKRSDEDVELEDDDRMGMSVAMPRDADDAYGIIRCVAGKCSALSPSEVASIPVCEFNNNKCYITLEYAMTKSATTSISAGNICTNVDRSVFYFATDTIVVKPNVISGVTATYVYTTTNSNCLEVNDSYTDMYFTVGSNIYLLDQGSVLQFYETGYYFINTAKNTLVSGNDIDAYNDENVKLYKCNGSSCSITDKPDSLTYYADVNKRILKYNVNSDSYSFAYSKDITCIFANNKCTPNADLKNQEFCITYKGELVLAKQDINNRETGECYKASSITNTIYGYSQYLYNMNIYSAKMVDETGYYIVNLSTNTTVVSKNYKTKNNNLVVYGCQLSSCKEFVPDEDIYYYDARAKTILRYLNGIWTTPSNSGYAYISLDPTNTYIYRFTKKLDEVTINAMANYGYYYTIGGEMYHCNQDEDGGCVPISSTGYYFTNAGEVYRCVHDSEELEPTECTKQACISGQYYYIDDAYYRCESSSTLVPVMSRYCSFSENVIINFPLALTEEYPDKIKQAVEGIEKNNNSTAVIINRGKNYLESVSGIFTNCTYNVEETKSTFDLVCVNNYVAVDKETDEVKICSVEQLGYVECVEDEENPEKCNVSWAFQTVLRPSFLFTLIITLFISFIYQL